MSETCRILQYKSISFKEDCICMIGLQYDSLSMINEWEIPGKSGYHLYATSDGKDLIMTVHTGLWLFDKVNKIEGFHDAENIKSMGRDTSGQYIYTVPEESWWTYHVSFFHPSRKLAFPDKKVYKTRWFYK